MKIAVGNSRMDKRWKNKDITWPAFKDTVRTTKRTTETVSEFRKMTKARQDSIKDIGGFVGGALREGKRRNGYVLCRSLLTLDMDYATTDTWEQLESLYDWACCLYSTHKHTPEAPRLRLVIPLEREVSEDEYPALGRMVAKEIGIDMFDDTTYEPSRLMYWPSTSSDGEFVFQEKDGALLNPDAYLSKYANWRDASMWPTSKRQSEVIQHSLKQQKDPLEKSGVVGAFCRAYSIEEAIGEFLPEVYEPSAMDGRFDYIPADSSAGVVIYGGKFAYSHHATDPVCGKLLNAFDLVRLHKYAELEEKASFKAMAEGSSAYVFHADTEGLNFRRAFQEAGFHISGVCIWVKNALVLGRSPYHWQHEPVLFGWLPNGKHKWFSDRKQSTIWNFDKPKRSAEHPTMKPVPLLAYPIKNSSAPNGIVLDTFGGSGSTMIACEQTDRICRMIELDPKYASVIVQRFHTDYPDAPVSVLRGGEVQSYEEIVK